MKILVVYYSRTGLTKKVGEKLAAMLSADQEEIFDQVIRSGLVGYLKCGREAMKKNLPVINPVKIDPAAYDLVLVGTPVWAGTMASPVRSYLTEQKTKIKRIAFFVTQGGQVSSRAINNMEEIFGQSPAASLVVLSREVARDNYTEKTQKFIKDLTS